MQVILKDKRERLVYINAIKKQFNFDEYEAIDTNNYSHLFDLIRRIVSNVLKKSRAGILLGLEDLGFHPQGFVGGYHRVGTNEIYLNRNVLQMMREVTPEAHYKATVDGEVIEGEALIVFILNAGSIGGVMGMELPKVGDVDISDGYLDLFAVTKSMKFVRAVSQHLYKQQGSDTGVYHWRGKEITLEADPAQDVWIDGEMGGQTPFTVSALPQALEIVVPG